MEPQHACITHNVASLRAEPDRRAEQVSQAIWGEIVRVLELRETFARVETPDGYQGWVMRRHLGPAPISEHATLNAVTHYTVAEPIVNVYAQDAARTTVLTKLVFGTRLAVPAAPFGTPPAYVPIELTAPVSEEGNTEEEGKAGGGNPEIETGAPVREEQSTNTLQGTIFTASLVADADRPGFSPQAACDLARQFAGTPYLWGGVTPFGFDCSGLVQRVFSFLGVLLPRDAHQQAASTLGTVLLPDAPLQPADLVFFGRPGAPPDAPRNNIVHVGLMLDADRVIHAYGRDGVVISSLTDSEIAQVFVRRSAWRLRSENSPG